MTTGSAQARASAALDDQLTGQRTGQVHCTAGDGRITSGGAVISPADSWLGSLMPVDLGDAGSKPDDAWRSKAFDALDGNGQFSVYGVCTKDVALRYVESALGRVEPGETRHRKARCASGDHVVGGGVKVSGLTSEAQVVASAPFDGSDGDSIPDDGWRVRVHGVSGDEQTVRAYAVCRA